jgi:hypothetical protein
MCVLLTLSHSYRDSLPLLLSRLGGPDKVARRQRARTPSSHVPPWGGLKVVLKGFKNLDQPAPACVVGALLVATCGVRSISSVLHRVEPRRYLSARPVFVAPHGCTVLHLRKATAAGIGADLRPRYRCQTECWQLPCWLVRCSWLYAVLPSWLRFDTARQFGELPGFYVLQRRRLCHRRPELSLVTWILLCWASWVLWAAGLCLVSRVVPERTCTRWFCHSSCPSLPRQC